MPSRKLPPGLRSDWSYRPEESRQRWTAAVRGWRSWRPIVTLDEHLQQLGPMPRKHRRIERGPGRERPFVLRQPAQLGHQRLLRLEEVARLQVLVYGHPREQLVALG